MDITQIKRALADRAQAVAEHLLPQGRKDGQEWRAGSVDGERGQSLGVHLSGAKAGVWADFNTGETGDLIDLWCATRKLPLMAALDEARRWLGKTPPKFRGAARDWARPPKPKCARPVGRVRDYLTEVRNIPEEILTRYRVGEDGDRIIFPFILPNGELAMAKTREAIDGGKTKPTAANCEPVLFGWQAIPEDAREVVITEGEIDALSMAAYSYPAMSVPFGGGKGAKQAWIENEFERMQRFERIYLALDMDKPGDEAAEEIANRLGRHRCYRVKLPHKDANQCLMEGVPKAAIDAAVAGAASLDPEGLRQTTDFIEELDELFEPSEGAHVGYAMPYGKLAGRLLFRPGELTLWSGASGSGKSQILSDCLAGFAQQGSVVCLASFEMKGKQSMRRLLKQVTGVEHPGSAARRETLLWLKTSLLVYELVGKTSVDSLLEVFAYARAKYGCDQFVVDSLMRLGVASDDYVGQERAVFKMVDFAISQDIHLHLVAHARKKSGDGGSPETEDVKGASEIGSNAANIVTVWRNKELEDEITALRAEIERGIGTQREFDGKQRELDELQCQPGVILNVAKQRNGDFEGKVGLWFDQATYRYRSFGDGPRQYLPPEAMARLKAAVS